MLPARWMNLANEGTAAFALIPAEFIQLGERVDEMPQPPERPTRPSSPLGAGLLAGFLANPDSVDAKAYAAEMATFEKAMRKYDRLSAKYERQLKALRQDTQAWFDAFTSYQDLGKDAAAELLPRREAVFQTAIPAQRVEKSKEK